MREHSFFISLKQYYNQSMLLFSRKIIQEDAILVLKWSTCIYLHRVCMNRINAVKWGRLVCHQNSYHLSESNISVNTRLCYLEETSLAFKGCDSLCHSYDWKTIPWQTIQKIWMQTEKWPLTLLFRAHIQYKCYRLPMYYHAEFWVM